MLVQLSEIYREMGDKMDSAGCKSIDAEMINAGVRGLLQLSTFLSGVHKGYVEQKIRDGLDGIEEAVDLFNRLVRRESRSVEESSAAGVVAGFPLITATIPKAAKKDKAKK